VPCNLYVCMEYYTAGPGSLPRTLSRRENQSTRLSRSSTFPKKTMPLLNLLILLQPVVAWLSMTRRPVWSRPRRLELLIWGWAWVDLASQLENFGQAIRRRPCLHVLPGSPLVVVQSPWRFSHRAVGRVTAITCSISIQYE
jgi:hypothetical protein